MIIHILSFAFVMLFTYLNLYFSHNNNDFPIVTSVRQIFSIKIMSLKTINSIIGWFSFITSLLRFLLKVKVTYISLKNGDTFFDYTYNVAIYISYLSMLLLTIIAAGRFLQGIERVRKHLNCFFIWISVELIISFHFRMIINK